MTIIELRRAYRSLFYSQSWFDGESLTRTLPTDDRPRMPVKLAARRSVPRTAKGLALAVDLLNAYVTAPDDLIWRGYLWCRDVDALGQRIYVGGTANGHGLEIHRHLAIDDRWAVPVW